MAQILFWICFLYTYSACLLSNKVNGETNTTEIGKATVLVPIIENITELPQSTTTNRTIQKEQNKTVEMQRITQPIAESHSSTQQIGRTLLPAVSSNISIDGKLQINDGQPKKPIDFKPSPQVDTYYEYNKFPVVPAHPEPKFFGGINLNEKPLRSDIPWLDNNRPNYPATTTPQPSWYNKINFPTTQNPFVTLRDHPYPYLLTGNYPETTTKIQYPYVITGTNSIDITAKSQYPFSLTGTNFETTTRNPGYGGGSGLSKFGGFGQGGGFSNKFGGFAGGTKNGIGGGGGIGGGNSLLQKTHFESPHSLTSSGSSISPWKKIIKFLTAFIPIGLLLSALTPTVINVAPMNLTQTRGRAEEIQRLSAEKLLTSLNYINKLNAAGCEERVVCELLLGAGSSSNAEHHIENILQAFTEQERDVLDQIEELNKIFQAVKSGDCTALECDSIQKNVENSSVSSEDEKV